jgi:hypothetical protein
MSGSASLEKETGPAEQNLHRLQPPIRLAQEMGEGMERGALLLRGVPPQASGEFQHHRYVIGGLVQAALGLVGFYGNHALRHRW